MNTQTVSTSNNNVGSAILAISGMVARSWKRKPSSKQIKCQIALEKAGVLRNTADRIESGKALSADAYKSFSKMAKAGDEGAARVIELAKTLAGRPAEITAYKASLVA